LRSPDRLAPTHTHPTPPSLLTALKKFIKKHAADEPLAVLDAKLGGLIKEKLGVACVSGAGVSELARGVRAQLAGLIAGLEGGSADLTPMALGLSHSLSRYKLKFSPDKVDTMVVQAIGLLDDLDKELNTYAMRTREWYGWHFPEMARVVNDNVAYAKCVRAMGSRDAAAATDFSGIPLDEATEASLKEAAAVSMGTEISEADLANIGALADQVIALAEYRAQLADYLRARMGAIAPNLTALVGELVGARLVSHAGSLISLAKQPASTVQILGAEKALFRALKTKRETPKYGLLYHASLVGQAPPRHKGRVARMLAAKCSLGVRVDALGDGADATVGLEGRSKVIYFCGWCFWGGGGAGQHTHARRNARRKSLGQNPTAAAVRAPCAPWWRARPCAALNPTAGAALKPGDSSPRVCSRGRCPILRGRERESFHPRDACATHSSKSHRYHTATPNS
jgi:nucleolar protein 58